MDSAVAARVKKRLAEQGHRFVFLDFDPADGIPAGRKWENELYQKLRECRAVIVLCSKHSMSSSWCFAEITHAKALGKHIFPIKTSPCTIVGLLADVQTIDITAIGEEEAYQRLWNGLKRAGLDPKDIFDWDGSRPPYPGLMAFEEQDAAVFFGRDSDIWSGRELLNRLRTFGGPRLILVLGASGCGKSSLMRAGILPRLKCDQRSWLVLDPFRPREDPYAQLGKVLAACFARCGMQRDWPSVRDVLKQGANAANPNVNTLLKLAEELREAAEKSEGTVLLTIDEMEELLSYASDEPASHFLPLLRAALEAEDSPLMAIATLRSDFLGAFHEHPALQRIAFESLWVGRMGPETMAQVIEGPAKVAGMALEPGLAQAMVHDTKTDDALPLLAFTLRELWETYGRDGLLEVEEYRKLGKLEGSAARAAEAVLSGYISANDAGRKEIESELRTALFKMVRVNEEGNYARRTARWSELPIGAHELLERYVKARLLMSIGDEKERYLEIAHETLFHSWGRFGRWLDEDREFMLWRRRLENAVNEWEQTGRDKDALLRGRRLAEAQRWLTQRSAELGKGAIEFIQASEDAAPLSRVSIEDPFELVERLRKNRKESTIYYRFLEGEEFTDWHKTVLLFGPEFRPFVNVKGFTADRLLQVKVDVQGEIWSSSFMSQTITVYFRKEPP
jgi:hypothetical protein